jgi:hypothetical protein
MDPNKPITPDNCKMRDVLDKLGIKPKHEEAQAKYKGMKPRIRLDECFRPVKEKQDERS